MSARANVLGSDYSSTLASEFNISIKFKLAQSENSIRQKIVGGKEQSANRDQNWTRLLAGRLAESKRARDH